MKKYVFVLTLGILILIAAACGSTDTATPEITATNTVTAPSEETTQPPVLTLTSTAGLPPVEVVPVQEIQNIIWQWIELKVIDPGAQALVPGPDEYTITFWEEDLYTAEIDCNQVTGEYYTDVSGGLSIKPGPTTLADCGADSLSDQFLEILNTATGFGILDGKLVLEVIDGSGQLLFENIGQAEKPEEQPAFCSGVMMDSVLFDTIDLPYAWQAVCVPGSQYDDSQPDGSTGLPEHVQIIFQSTDQSDNPQPDPALYIIPVEAYIELWESNGDYSVTINVDELEVLLDEQPDPIPSRDMPVLPFEQVTGINDLSVQGRYLTVRSGQGVRFVGRFSQIPRPISNDNPQLFYIYQGFSEDEQYLISFFYPVTTESLPNSDQIDSAEQQEFNNNAQAYMDEAVLELNALGAADWVPNLIDLDTVIDTLEFEYERIPTEPTPVPPAQLTNINWAWTDLTDTQPATQAVIEEPNDYLLIFYNDGSVNITSDCNFGGGTYTTQGFDMRIQVGVLTKADCGADSLSDRFVALLNRVTSYKLTSSRLVLYLADESGLLGFANRGGSVVAPPGENVPTVVTTETLNVRSGPGTQYYSYGTVPVGTRFTIIGISQDGNWYVVQVPDSLASDGRGWISARYTIATNIENIPIIPAPPVPNTPTPTATGLPTSTATSTPTATIEPTVTATETPTLTP